MIEYNTGPQVVVMDLVDLEHCGFRHEDFVFELQAGGIDAPAAAWPVALLVNFAGGAVATPTTSDETIAEMKDAHAEFKTLQKAVCRWTDLAAMAELACGLAARCGDWESHECALNIWADVSDQGAEHKALFEQARKRLDALDRTLPAT